MLRKLGRRTGSCTMTERMTAAEFVRQGPLTEAGKRRLTPETALKRACDP
jgi:hypothetical protein